MKSPIKSLTLLFYILLIPFKLYAQTDNIQFSRINTDKGLSHDAVDCILQDSKGFMWFGTNSGLNRYDGYNFIIYKNDPNNPNSISDNRIISMYEDRQGTLWIGTFSGGLNKYNRKTGEFQHYKHNPNDSNSISSNYVISIHEDMQGILWVGTYGGGLNEFNKNTGEFIHYKHNPDEIKSLSSDYITSICGEKSGILWIGTDGGGLDEFNSTTGEFFHYKHNPNVPFSLSCDKVSAVCEGSSGALWVGTFGGGFNKFDRKTSGFEHFKYNHENIFNATDEFSYYTHNPGESYNIGIDFITSILKDRSGTLWIATYGGGVIKFNQETGEFINYKCDYSNPNSISHDLIKVIYEDRAGIVWLGTYGGGLTKFNNKNKQFKIYKSDPNNPNSLSDHNVRAIYEDREGTIWIGTKNGGLSKFNRNTGKFFTFKHNSKNPYSLNHNYVRLIYEDKFNNLWIGTVGGGLSRFDKKAGRFFAYKHNSDNPYSISSNYITSIYEDKSGTFWIGTVSGGLNKFNRETDEFISYKHNPMDPSSIGEGYISSIHEDRLGNLWIGASYGGLNKFIRELGEFIRYEYNSDNIKSLSSNEVRSIYEDKNGTLWMGTFGGGLNRFDRATEEFEHFRVEDGLISEIVYSILEDDNGNLWLGTDKGLSMLNPRTKKFRNYDGSDGIQGGLFNINTCYNTKDGEMFFGGTKGLNSFYPDSIKDNRYIPPIVITDFIKYEGGEKLNREISEVEEITISHNDNVFSFEYASLHFNLPERNQYAYKMEGFNDEWIYSGTQRHAIFTNLNPGKYVFKVKGTNSDGVWNEEGTSVKITIIPPFWQTIWFRIFSIFSLFCIVFLMYRLRIRNINRINKRLDEEVKRKTIELRNEVSERKAGEKRYRILTDNLKEIIFTINKRMKITYINPSVYTLQGFKPEEIINKKINEILTPKSFEKTINILQNKLNEKYYEIENNSNIQQFEVEFYRKDGSTILTEVGFSTLRNSDGEIVSILGVARDITERKEAEKSLEEYRKHINQSDRLAATGRVAASIAHEINNPLQSIKVNTELVEDVLKDNLQQKHNIKRIKTGTDKIREIVKQLLFIHRQEVNMREKVSVNKVLLSTLNLLASQLEIKRIKVEKDLSHNIPRVNAIDQELYQVFMNLILNAQDAMEDGGIIKISTKVEGRNIYIVFQDNGVGISDNIIENIFEPFYTTKSKMLGMGLGLSTSKRIIESFLGKIDVKSKIGEGAIFTIVLPVVEE